jgi:hypothetical protein
MTGTPDRDEVIALRDAASAALEAGREQEARAAFAEAQRLSCTVLPATDPARLAVAGAHADAWFESWGDIQRAFEIAQAAYEEAIEHIDGAVGEHRRDAVRHLSQLRDRMTFWAFTMDVS